MLSLTPFVLRVLIVLCVTLSGKPMAATSSSSGALEVVSGVGGGLPTKLTVVSASGVSDAGTRELKADLATATPETHVTRFLGEVLSEADEKETSPSRRAVDHMLGFMNATVTEVDSWRAHIKTLSIAATTQAAVVAFLQKEQGIVTRLDEALEKASVHVEFAKNPGTIPWSLKYQKMGLALTGALELVAKQYRNLCVGNMPDGFSLPVTSIPRLGPDNTHSSWGKPGTTYLKLAYVSILKFHYSTKEGKDLSFADLSPYLAVKGRSGDWLSHSVTAYSVPVPIPELSSILEESAFRGPPTIITIGATEYKTMGTMTIVHSGYGFGMPLFSLVDKISMPLSLAPAMDCSSYVFAFIGGSRLNTAGDFPNLDDYNDAVATGKSISTAVDDWAKGSAGRFVLKTISRVVGPIKRDDIYWHRNHIAIVLGVLPNSDLITLDYNRSIEAGLEGFGWVSRPNDPSKVRVYRVNKSTS